MGVAPVCKFSDISFSTSTDVLFSLPGSQVQKTCLESYDWKNISGRKILISSIGYYGIPQKDIQIESPKGISPHAENISQTEELFAHLFPKNSSILCTGGLYSELKGPFAALEGKKQPPIGPPDRPLTLIHYWDLATAVSNVFQKPEIDPKYLSIVLPYPTRKEFYELACSKLNLPSPKYSKPLDCGKIQYENQSFIKDLLPNPKYPDWRTSIELYSLKRH